MLILRPARLWIEVEAKSMFGAVGQRLADLEISSPAAHAIVALDHLLLCRRQARIWRDRQCDPAMPVMVRAGGRFGRAEQGSTREAPQHIVLERAVLCIAAAVAAAAAAAFNHRAGRLLPASKS